jgi:hypothetical protein
MWIITISAEVSLYLFDSTPYVAEIIAALESLADTADGIPSAGCTQLEPNTFMWEVADHLVVYERLSTVAPPRLRVLVLKPMD